MKKTIAILSTVLSVTSLNLVAENNNQQVLDAFGLSEKPVNIPWNPKKPWKEPQDTTTAMNNPDLYAWQLFVSLNWPADTNTCKPDKYKKIGDPGRVVWEVWQSREETFLDGAAKPATWSQGCKDGGFLTLPEEDFTVFATENVRLNRKAYRYIRQNKLYSLDEQERLARAGVRDLEFPLGSKETKAHWVRINEEDKPRYHWAEIERDGETHLYGLSGLHIVSKDTPTWFWSTFEHVDNDDHWPLVHPDAFQGWKTLSMDSVACPADNLDCNKIPAGFGLEGTKWQYYRLRGTQSDWVDNRGNPTVLANSQLESFMDLNTSSCVTCHALSVKGVSGDPRPISFFTGEVSSEGYRLGYVGAAEPELFLNELGEEIPYLGLDYVYTLRNAKREK